MNDAKQTAFEAANAEILSILSKATTIESLAAEYVRVNNTLKIEADAGNEYDYYYTLELNAALKNIIVIKLLKKLGYYENENDTYKRWEKE